jgi:hypothetical protein
MNIPSTSIKPLCLSLCGSTALVELGRFFSFLICTQSVGLSVRGSARRKAATYTQGNTNTEKTHTDIYPYSGIRTHDTSLQAGEDGSCRRSRGHCDRNLYVY